MKIENFERAKAIEAEINSLMYYRDPLLVVESKDISLVSKGRIKEGDWRERSYRHTGDCPVFLKEQIEDDLNFIADRILAKINKRIAELEKEFESL